MADNPFTKTETAPIDRAIIAQSDSVITGGASWFFWIAGLSIVNTAMIHSGSDTSFVIGLGFTLVADAMFKAYKLVAFGIDAVALGAFFGLGFLARKGHLWAFVTGIVLYGLDALIYLAFQDWMSVAFHGLALFYLFRGAKALHTALKAAKEAPPVAEPPPVANA